MTKPHPPSSSSSKVFKISESTTTTTRRASYDYEDPSSQSNRSSGGPRRATVDAANPSPHHGISNTMSIDTRYRRSHLLAGIGENNNSTTILKVERVRVPSSPPPPVEIDLSEMSPSDLLRLKEEDPFMYYSIPAVHSRSYKMNSEGAEAIAAAVLGDGFGDDDDDDERQEEAAEVERRARAMTMQDQQDQEEPRDHHHATNNNNGRRRRPVSRPRHASCPAGMLANADISYFQNNILYRSSSSVVNKRRRISVEAHPSLVCEDLLMEMAAVEEQGGGRLGSRGGRAVSLRSSSGSTPSISEASEEEEEEDEDRFLLALIMGGELGVEEGGNDDE